MKPITIFVVLIMIEFALIGGSLVHASPTPKDLAGSGGTISGTVISPSGTVVDWAQIYATGGNQTFEAFSGFSGFYLMRVPAGAYNVSVVDIYNPYWAPSVNVTVTDGSSSTVNLYLQQSPSPVPPYQPATLGLMSMLSIIAACGMARRLKKRSIFV